MNKHYDPHFQKDIITIHPGEYYTSKEDIYIATVLGSCISVALYDIKLGFGGMNHFMLPKSSRDEPLSSEDEGRFGNYAMELLINDMINNGSSKQSLRAKVFGGGNVLDAGNSQMNMTGINNINFALNYLKAENIPIIVNDTGGIFPRKIYFNPLTSKVYLKRIQKSGQSVEQIKQRELEYKLQLQAKKEEAGNIVWF
ncbi:MAG: chemotaxis protein CheD [Spirochaetaceae bacterium]|nr:chemotaxis protein CheD [Spirochaetaceae bacterium]MBQ4555159.1 chemotaxis protein CheD [Spirochaetaceae bacterium]MBQ8353811.1 chemotaxis protein CheD [Spirochaetaceae bacterium]MBR4011917.1 chemotaxis protein CheD [Spirochaetaceae bacterium]